MFENSSNDPFLPSSQDKDLVDDLLCSDDSEATRDTSFSLTKALLPLVEPPSSSLVPWVCSTRYKTALCTSYATSGFCKYAERCQFAHGLRELHVPFRHPKYKTELCRNYHTTGYCFYGGRCLFVHSPTEMRQVQRHRRNIPCRKFLANRVCPFGKRCNFLHVEDEVLEDGYPAATLDPNSPAPTDQVQPQRKVWKPKGALCHTFSTFGFCLYGTSCCFQHGLPSKIKTADLSQAQFLSPQPTPSTAGLPSISSNGSTSSSTSTSPRPALSPSPEVMVHNAFTFSSHHLNDLLLPLAIHLQQLESTKGQEVWDSRAL
ncbi:cysteine three histidine 1 [Gambusia affinis]|uniref:cysteine three histidine 1 n=1 Tax=Gambusia affinis TaxID=33528 RepID=UPI001CDC7419|nr:cysteine three histidine 1 [Gambusia affinis]